MGEGSNLRVRLLGTWQLVSAVIRFEDGELRNQFGDDAYGFLIYSADGYVRAVLGARDRAAIASDAPAKTTDAESAGEEVRFLACCGPFTVDEERSAVKHSIEVSLSPSWLGREEMRAASFVGEQLVLTTDSRLSRDGRMSRVEVTWKRPG